jgi:hypothetical protein
VRARSRAVDGGTYRTKLADYDRFMKMINGPQLELESLK